MRSPFSPISLVSGLLTFGLITAHAMLAMAVVPHLIELLATEPRLAMLGFFALIASPGIAVVIVHHFGHRLLQGAERVSSEKRALLPSVESWWAGALAWLVLYGTSLVSRLIFLVINPPEPQPDALFTIVTRTIEQSSPSHAMSLYTAIWVLVASTFYELERRTRSRGRA